MFGDFNFTVHKNKSEPLVNNLYKLHQHTFASDSVQNFDLELVWFGVIKQKTTN